MAGATEQHDGPEARGRAGAWNAPPVAGPDGGGASRRPADLSPALSLWLDVLRVLAALVVVLGHAGNRRFTDGALFWVRDWTLAPDAVIAFFVVSGLVVGRAAARDGTGRTYAFNRLTRLLGVVGPALVLTLALDAAGRAIDPGAYRPAHFGDLGPGELLARGLTFSQQWRGVGPPVQLGSNAPLWSLSFEAAYYLLLGIALFVRGWRVRTALLAALGWLFGLSILLLLPTWLAGLGVWHLIRAGRIPARRATAILLAVLPVAALVAAKLAHLDEALLQATPHWLGPVRHRQAFDFAQEAAWNALLAAGLALHLVGMARVAPRLGTAAARAVRWWAGASFSIYVVHYPVMHLMDAVLPEDVPAKAVLFVALPIAAGLAFAQVFERTLPGMRRAVGRAMRHGGR
ncbi:acyltransferase [Jannaschia sp. Os4]|uniref:acyltransferase family protein n=1 Tax=Jannaschia sp. Os4 TaxID=2807617 RepID=UPI00193A99E1|nr:acyltransferase [Jannaschia sp. Os4]MBM2576357.1 acyltransferase [Jannaschia sp. Os4]